MAECDPAQHHECHAHPLVIHEERQQPTRHQQQQLPVIGQRVHRYSGQAEGQQDVQRQPVAEGQHMQGLRNQAPCGQAPYRLAQIRPWLCQVAGHHQCEQREGDAPQLADHRYIAAENHFGDMIAGHRQQREPLQQLAGAAAEGAARRGVSCSDVLRAHAIHPLRPAGSISPGIGGITP
ncbi:hypothetical protein D3C81_1358240 [compost metagenome]